MARAKAQDFLHNFRFQVSITGADDTPGLPMGSSADESPSAGFSAVSIPEISQDAVEYREGHYVYARKHAGLPTVSNVTLSRGVALQNGRCWTWIQNVVEGNFEYRADMNIFHYHRDAKPATTSSDVGGVETFPDTTRAGIVYSCKNVFPIRYKPSSDLDGTSSEISIQELEVAVESFSVSPILSA